MLPTIRVIFPAGPGPQALLPLRLAELEAHGFRVLCAGPPAGPQAWPYTAGSPHERAAALTLALGEEESDILLCGRGGYGASDLLPLLPWNLLKAKSHKWLVGFSDVSALQSALWTQLAWPSLHGPMPLSELWGRSGGDDLAVLFRLLQAASGEVLRGELSLDAWACADKDPARGWLFGGCFAVLTNLIGTAYFPPSLAGAIVFLEDIGENPGRLMRYWNQWLQSGVLKGAAAVVLGDLCEHGSALEAAAIKGELARRCDVPVWSSSDFGHTSPNFPLIVGAAAHLDPASALLTYEFTRA